MSTMAWVGVSWLASTAVFVVGYVLGFALGQRATEQKLARRMWLVNLSGSTTDTWTPSISKRETDEWRS
jgi:hypothetical protein